MKIAVLTSRFPFPLERRDKLRSYHQIRHLSQDHEVYLFCVCDVVPSESHMAEMYTFCKRVEYIHVDLPTFTFNILKNYSTELPFQ
ncbi:MAG TPA: hypothetical protein PKD85_20530, partial [Saprospiraceae bacterium]|nr:hypothetical protein [Saprospiraceae bacterium]